MEQNGPRCRMRESENNWSESSDFIFKIVLITKDTSVYMYDYALVEIIMYTPSKHVCLT